MRLPPFVKEGFAREDVVDASPDAPFSWLSASRAPAEGQIFKLQVSLTKGTPIVEGTVTQVIDRDHVCALLEDMSGESTLLRGASIATLARDASMENPWVLTGLLLLHGDEASGEEDLDAMKVEALLREAGLARDRGKLDAAQDAATRALRIRPNSAEAHLRLAQCASSKNEHAIAEAEATRAETLGLRTAEVYNLRGCQRHLLGRLDEAMADYELSLAIDPGHSVAKQNLGEAAQGLGDHDRAITLFSEVIAAGTREASVFHLRGVSLAARGDLSAATADFDEAIRRSARFAGAYLERGKCHERKGAMNLATDDWKRALELGATEAGDRIRDWERRRALAPRRPRPPTG